MVAELEKFIDKFYVGDAEAIPSIFEEILKRKLAGKYEEVDKELIYPITSKVHFVKGLANYIKYVLTTFI